MIPLLGSYIAGMTLFYLSISSVPFFTNPVYLPKIAVLALGTFLFSGLYLFLTRKRRKKKIIFTRFHILILVLGFMHTVALIFSKSRAVSFFGLYSAEVQNYLFIIIVLLFSLLSSLNKPSKIPNYFFLAGVFLQISFVLFQGLVLKTPRPNGLEGHPIWSAGVIALGLLISLEVLKYHRLFKIFFVVYCIAGLVILDSSTVWVSLAFSLGITVLLRFPWKIRFLLIFLAGAVTLAVFLPKEQFSIEKRIEEYGSITRFLSQKKLSLFGNGQNTSGLLLLPYRTIEQSQDSENYYRSTTIHNQYIESFFSTGLLGIICWLFFLYFGIKNSTSSYRFTVWLFFISWQLLYYLPFTLFCMLFYIASQNKADTTINTVRILPKHMQVLLSGILIFLTLFLYILANEIRSEIAFSQGKQHKALDLSLLNDRFIRSVSHDLLQQALSCYKTVPPVHKQTAYYLDRFHYLNQEMYYNTDPNLKNQAFSECTQISADSLAQKAIDNLHRTTLLNPLHPDNWNAYGTALFQIAHATNHQAQKQTYIQMAFSSYQKALEIEPLDPLYLDNLGLVYLDLKDFGKATFYFKKALEINPQSTVSLKHLQETVSQQSNESAH